MDIPGDQFPLIIRALEHYADCLKAMQRDDRLFRELAERMTASRQSRKRRSRSARQSGRDCNQRAFTA